MRRLLALALFAAAALAADISGTWNITVETDAGSGNPVFVLKQTGEQLAGTYTGLLGDKLPVSGTLKGDKLEISFSGAVNGENVKCTYSGTVTGDTKMQGTVQLGSLGSGKFTGEKK